MGVFTWEYWVTSGVCWKNKMLSEFFLILQGVGGGGQVTEQMVGWVMANKEKM